jgi:hypothetical protein
MATVNKAETFQEAFDELVDASFLGKLKRDTNQWNTLRRFFFAGAFFLVTKVNEENEVNVGKLLDELCDFYDEVQESVKLKQDIERSGQ